MRGVLVALGCVAGVAACARPVGVDRDRPSGRGHPRLVVVIVIDQWPSWMFEKQQHLFTGGIGRLLREGAVIPAADIPYASTMTSQGHAAIATGAPPHDTGIVGNRWWRRDEQKDRPSEFDPASPVLAVAPPLTSDKPDGASGRALRVDGIADIVRATTHGHTVAIGLKAHAACFVAGKHPELAIWYEPGAGGMTTSRAYVAEPPPWLVRLAHDDPPSRYLSRSWTPRDAALLARETPVTDHAPGEGSEHGFGAAFPHDLANTKSPAMAIIETPFGDELVANAVLAAIDGMQLGKDDVPDLLAVSFNAHDYAGHSWGPESWEVLDMTLRLDALLGVVFEQLDVRVGKDRWAVIVTSDHGATPLVEHARVQAARRIPTTELVAAIERAIGAGTVAKVSSNNIYLKAHASDAQLDAAADALQHVPQIAFAGRSDRACERPDAICAGTVPGEAGELYAYPKEGSLVTDYTVGTAHDAPVDDNRRVPILVKAPGLRPQSGRDASLLQVAPTLAVLLGVPPPPAAKQPPLFDLER